MSAEEFSKAMEETMETEDFDSSSLLNTDK
jgi:hypothetical protein